METYLTALMLLTLALAFLVPAQRDGENESWDASQ